MKLINTIVVVLMIASCISCKTKSENPRYSTTVFDVRLSGSHRLGEDEYSITNLEIKPVQKRVSLGEPFCLERPGIVYLCGTFKMGKDVDHLVFAGSLRAQNRNGKDLNQTIDGLDFDMYHVSAHVLRLPIGPNTRASPATVRYYLFVDKVILVDQPPQDSQLAPANGASPRR